MINKIRYEVYSVPVLSQDKYAYEILGDIDEIKLHSSMTLFVYVSNEGSVFHKALNVFYDGEMDELTLENINIWKLIAIKTRKTVYLHNRK